MRTTQPRKTRIDSADYVIERPNVKYEGRTRNDFRVFHVYTVQFIIGLRRGALKKQDWKMTDKMSGVETEHENDGQEFDGQENDGQQHRMNAV